MKNAGFKYFRLFWNLPVEGEYRNKIIKEKRSLGEEGYANLSNKEIFNMNQEARYFMLFYIDTLMKALPKRIDLEKIVDKKDITFEELFRKICQLANIDSFEEALQFIKDNKTNNKKHK